MTQTWTKYGPNDSTLHGTFLLALHNFKPFSASRRIYTVEIVKTMTLIWPEYGHCPPYDPNNYSDTDRVQGSTPSLQN